MKYFQALICTLLLVDVAPAQTQQSTAKEFSKLLEVSLTRADLSLTNSRLTKAISVILQGSKTKRVAKPGSVVGLTRVAKSQAEWILVVHDPRGEMAEGLPSYWIGLNKGQVVVQLLPGHPDDDMLGPVIGEWRRHGAYLIGAGQNQAFHAPNFSDGEIDVYEETALGLKLVQRERIDLAVGPVSFVSELSDELTSREEDYNDLKTLSGRILGHLTRRKNWVFKGGKCSQASTSIEHDALWAIDQLATAIVQHETAEIDHMIPNAKIRAKLVPILSQILRHRKEHPVYENADYPLAKADDDRDIIHLETDYADTPTCPWIEFKNVSGHWTVSRLHWKSQP